MLATHICPLGVSQLDKSYEMRSVALQSLRSTLKATGVSMLLYSTIVARQLIVSHFIRGFPYLEETNGRMEAIENGQRH